MSDPQPTQSENPVITTLEELNAEMKTSEKQIAANQRNAQRSTGPRTHKGKLRAAQNATTHGAYSTSTDALNVGVHREDPKALNHMIDEIVMALAPRNRAEVEQAKRVARAYLAHSRLDHFQTAVLDGVAETHPDAIFMSYEAARDLFHTALVYDPLDPSTWPDEEIDWQLAVTAAKRLCHFRAVKLSDLGVPEPLTDEDWRLAFKALIAELFPQPADDLVELERSLAKEIRLWWHGTKGSRITYAEQAFTHFQTILDARARTDRSLRANLDAYRTLRKLHDSAAPDDTME